MLNFNRQSIRITLISLGSILLILAINIAENTETLPAITSNTAPKTAKPSAYLINSTFNLFDADGKSSQLHASKAFFFKNQDYIKIEKPVFSTTKTSSKILLTAKEGLYHPSNESLVLEGNVIAKQTDDKQTVWQLETNTLNIDNKNGILFTNEAVNVTSGHNNLKAVGITASLNNRQLKLLSNVRGKYVFE